MEASTGAPCSPPADERPAPAISLPAAVRWQENSTSWTFISDITPAQAARLVRLGGFQADPDLPYRFWPAKPPARGQLTLTLSAGLAEWQTFQQEMEQRPRRRRDTYTITQAMHLEWPLLHPALSCVRLGEFEVGQSLLRFMPDTGRMEVVAPVNSDVISAMTNSGYQLHPVDDWKEQVTWNDAVMGLLLKPEQLHTAEGEETPPFLLLHGLEHSLGHPLLMRPFLSTLPAMDISELERIIGQTAQMEDHEPVEPDGIEDPDTAQMLAQTYQEEWSGIDQQDMPILLHMLFALAEGVAEVIADSDEPDEETVGEAATTLLVGLLCGSRVMRAELAHRGYETTLGERRLGERETMALAYGGMYTAEALGRAVGDMRAARVWSLPLTAAMSAERQLLTHLSASEQAGHVAEEIIGDIFLCFDLGVRYQLARVAPHILADEADEISGDDHAVGAHA